MSSSSAKKPTWHQALVSWTRPESVTMLFLGFSAGIPILLIFSTLTAWLKEAEVSRATVTFFSWAALGYSFKFIWAPLVDLLPIPLLDRLLGRRRSWILVSQVLIIIAICWMGSVNPVAEGGLTLMAMAAVMLGFSSATQDIAIDAYRIERAEPAMQALLASMYTTGYRLAMIVSGAGSLYLAGWLGTQQGAYSYSAWRATYLIMGAVMLIGIITTLVVQEPEVEARGGAHQFGVREYGQLLILFAVVAATFGLCFFHLPEVLGGLKQTYGSMFGAGGKLAGFLYECTRFFLSVSAAAVVASGLMLLKVVEKVVVMETYVLPVLDFFKRYKGAMALIILLLVGFYRVSDIVLGVISNLFYLDIGFTKEEVAAISKVYGVFMTIAGTLLGGILTVRYGVYRILFTGALLSAATNLLFMLLAKTGADLSLLTVVIALDNLSGGVAVAAFIAFLSSLTSVSFTAVQYAIFSSVMTLFPKLIGGYSGTIVNSIGYEQFFLMTAVLGIPVLFLVWLVRHETG